MNTPIICFVLQTSSGAHLGFVLCGFEGGSRSGDCIFRVLPTDSQLLKPTVSGRPLEYPSLVNDDASVAANRNYVTPNWQSLTVMTMLLRTLIIVALIAGVGATHPLFAQSAKDALNQEARKPPAALSISTGEVWRAHSPYLTLDEIGSHKGIVFSPDLSEPDNREFFRALGFAYFEDPDWHVVLEQIKEYNATHSRNRIETLLVLSHGTNGDALKLQNGSQPDAPRSYIAPAALQENLEGTGIRFCLLAACNAGRLFRPDNYRTVRADTGNRLFEPPTLGIINASPDFNPSKSSITIARRAESHLEVINECSLSELSAGAIAELSQDGESGLTAASRIAVPEMLIQLLLKDDDLRLVLWGSESVKSSASTTDKVREGLINRFFDLVDGLTRDQ